MVFDTYGKPLAVMPGLQSFIEDDADKYRRRVHEAAHVTANHFLAGAYATDWVSVRPPLSLRWGGARGAFRMNAPKEPSEASLHAQLVMTRAARVGVTMICGGPGSEASYSGDDEYSRYLIEELHGEVSPDDEERILAEADAEATKLLDNHRDSMIALADRLDEKHTLSLPEIEETIGWYRWTRPKTAPQRTDPNP